MSTRGFISFAIDGETKTTYNHFDSYPDGLGLDVLRWLRQANLAATATAVRALRAVTDDDEVTDQDIERLAPYTNLSVGGRSERPTWYQLLDGTHGKPSAILAAGVFEDASDFPADSLFAEWGYVVDLDAGVLEVYRGFQTKPHKRGRFAALEPERDNGYYPVRLVESFPLADLPSEDQFVAMAERAAESGDAS